jgi:hypothetical protein
MSPHHVFALGLVGWGQSQCANKDLITWTPAVDLIASLRIPWASYIPDISSVVYQCSYGMFSPPINVAVEKHDSSPISQTMTTSEWAMVSDEVQEELKRYVLSSLRLCITRIYTTRISLTELNLTDLPFIQCAAACIYFSQS